MDFYQATINAIDGELKIDQMVQYASPKRRANRIWRLYLYGYPKVENGACVSSFIISGTTAATRARYMVTVPTENNLYNRPLTVVW